MTAQQSPTLMPQRGAVTLLVALTLPLLVGLAALAIDLAHLHVVRNELQNDADAAALAGAMVLYKNKGKTLDWDAAAAQAQDAIALNHADGQPLLSARVDMGYWDMGQDVLGLQVLPTEPTSQDAPALQVRVSKIKGENDGPVRTFLTGIWNMVSKPVSATAVAGVASPGRIYSGGVFPFAISECMYQNFWNSSSSPAGPRKDAGGQALVFRVGSLYAYDSCDSGEWSSLAVKASGVHVIAQLIEDGSPSTLSLDEDIWVQTGVKNSLFQAVQDCSAAGTQKCEFVVMPVLTRVTPGSFSKIRGFACMHILNAEGGNGKYIELQMSTLCQAPNSSGVGPNYGVMTPPRLFR
ncbi:MAG: pilus assembly protein TadE [Comamonadaceae bacterium PBBC1]|nr:MAG: pilus assembly protein TadE [Comamonadaceae bacterium PBBC1]